MQGPQEDDFANGTSDLNAAPANGHAAAPPRPSAGAQAKSQQQGSRSVPAAAQTNGSHGTNGKSASAKGDFQHPMDIDEVRHDGQASQT